MMFSDWLELARFLAKLEDQVDSAHRQLKSLWQSMETRRDETDRLKLRMEQLEHDNDAWKQKLYKELQQKGVV